MIKPSSQGRMNSSPVLASRRRSAPARSRRRGEDWLAIVIVPTLYNAAGSTPGASAYCPLSTALRGLQHPLQLVLTGLLCLSQSILRLGLLVHNTLYSLQDLVRGESLYRRVPHWDRDIKLVMEEGCDIPGIRLTQLLHSYRRQEIRDCLVGRQIRRNREPELDARGSEVVEPRKCL